MIRVRRALLFVLLLATHSPSAQEFYPATFWPGVADSAAAEAVALEAGQERLDLDFLLQPEGGTVSGQVLDVQGDPLAGVLVVALSEATVSHAYTDPSGLFSIPGVAPGPCIVRAWTFDPRSTYQEMQPLFAPGVPVASEATRYDVRSGETTTGVVLVLREGGVITGALESTDGEPLERIRVEAVSLDSGEVFWSKSVAGRYAIRGLPPGSYLLSARRGLSPFLDTYWPGVLDSSQALAVQIADPPDSVTADLQMTREARIFGVVRLEGTGEGLAGAEVQAISVTSDFVRTTTTDDHGFYIMDALRPGSYLLYVPNIARYYPSATSPSEARAVAVQEGEDVYEINIRGSSLPDCPGDPGSMGVVKGTVVAQEDAPLGAITVTATGPVVRSTTLSIPGPYTLDCLLPGTYIVSASSDSTVARVYYEDSPYAETATPVQVAAEDTVEAIDLFLPPGARLGGTVRAAPDGIPLAGLRVRVTLLETGAVMEVRTAEDGTWRISSLPDGSGLPAGSYVVSTLPHSTGGIHPTPVLAVPLDVEPTRDGVRLCVPIAGVLGEPVPRVLRRRGDATDDVTGTLRTLSAGNPLLLLDPNPPPGRLGYQVELRSRDRVLRSPWVWTLVAPQPRSAGILAAGPQPASGRWELRIAYEPEAYRVEILDVSGRRLRLLEADTDGVFRWLGRSATGAPAPSGCYFYRVLRAREPGSAVARGKILWLR
jgi:hypothetical protein